MSNDERIRRFLRRETDEWTHLVLAFRPEIALLGFLLFRALTSNPGAEVLDVEDAEAIEEDGVIELHFPDAEKRRHRDVEVEYGRTELMVSRGVALLRGSAPAGVPTAVAVDTNDTGVVTVRLTLRADDSDRLDEVSAEVERLLEKIDPYRGKALALGPEGVSFLPPPKVDDDDIVLPEGTTEMLARSFAFLDDPEPWPRNLRRRGVLLAGPPGVGKTLTARWLSARLSATTLWITPGVLASAGPATVFGLARRLKPTLLILEDLDGLEGPGQDPAVYGALLGEMDGFKDLDGIGVLATTNRLETFSEALHPEDRPGRFHRIVEFPLPDAALRQRMIAGLFSASAVFGRFDDVTSRRLVERTEGMTGAQIAEMVRELESRTLWNLQHDLSVEPAVILEGMVEEGRSRTSLGFG